MVDFAMYRFGYHFYKFKENDNERRIAYMLLLCGYARARNKMT